VVIPDDIHGAADSSSELILPVFDALYCLLLREIVIGVQVFVAKYPLMERSIHLYPLASIPTR
jgi:hypothetical protein